MSPTMLMGLCKRKSVGWDNRTGEMTVHSHCTSPTQSFEEEVLLVSEEIRDSARTQIKAASSFMICAVSAEAIYMNAKQ
jgi:hypothetical protein